MQRRQILLAILLSVLHEATSKAGESSFTIIMDRSGSMSAAATAVREGAVALVKDSQIGNQNCMKNYVAIYDTSNQVAGGAEIVKKYATSEQYTEALKGLEIENHGHNRFKELALALQESEPYSYIFMFTDEQPYDNFTDNIQILLEEKKSKVTLVWCNDNEGKYTDAANQKFIELTEFSGGNVFKMDRNKLNAGNYEQINQVINYASRLINEGCSNYSRGPIIEEKKNSSSGITTITFEESVKTIDIIVTTEPSTAIVKTLLIYPRGDSGAIQNYTIMSNSTGKLIVSVDIPIDKTVEYVIDVDTTGASYTVKGEGISYLQFDQSFSNKHIRELAHGDKQPQRGSHVHAYIQMINDLGSGDTNKLIAKSVSLLDKDSNVIQTVSLDLVTDQFYASHDKLKIPNKDEMIKLRVDGEYGGKPFTRISMHNIMPARAIILPATSQIIVGDYNSTITITGETELKANQTITVYKINTTEVVCGPIQRPTGGNFSCVIANADSNGYTIEVDTENNVYTKNVTVNLREIKPVLSANQSETEKERQHKLTYGKNITLDCNLRTPSESAKFTWEKDGVEVTEGINSTKISSHLTIKNANQSDTGLYKCLVATDKGADSIKFTVTVPDAPKVGIISHLAPEIINGEKFQLRGVVLTNPKPTITILRNGVELNLDGRVHLTTKELQSDKATLLHRKVGNKTSIDDQVEDENIETEFVMEISNAEAEDAGVYEVIAENINGRGTAVHRVNYLVEIFQCTEVNGLLAQDNCEKEDAKTPLEQKFTASDYLGKGGEYLKSAQTQMNSFTKSISHLADYNLPELMDKEKIALLKSRLFFAVGMALQSSRTYVDAYASMIAYERLHNVKLYRNVTLDAVQAVVAPVLTARTASLRNLKDDPYPTTSARVAPSMVAVTKGEPISLRCSILNPPADVLIKIRWVLNGKPIVNASEGLKYMDHSVNDTLRIAHASEEDMGFYQCVMSINGAEKESDPSQVIFASTRKICPIQPKLLGAKQESLEKSRCLSEKDTFWLSVKNYLEELNTQVNSSAQHVDALLKLKQETGNTQEEIDRIASQRNKEMTYLNADVALIQQKFHILDTLLTHEMLYSDTGYMQYTADIVDDVISKTNKLL